MYARCEKEECGDKKVKLEQALYEQWRPININSTQVPSYGDMGNSGAADALESESDKVKVRMEFVEMVTQEGRSPKQVALEQEDVWIHEDNNWYLLRASSRAHVPFTE